MSTTIYIEESGTPIYTRIAKALGAELSQLGMSVMIVKPAAFNHDSYLALLRQLPADCVYLTNAGSNAINGRMPAAPSHYFEHFAGRVIFLHQDSILSGLTFDQALSRLQAWQRTAQRSAHLCIEPSNVEALQLAGIEHAVVVPHASEIQVTEPATDGFAHQASFVGHVVPSVYRQTTGSTSVDALMNRLFAHRQTHVAAPVQVDLTAFADQALECLGTKDDTLTFRLAYRQWLRGQLMSQSLQYRGWVFEHANIDDLCIFGGDPAYLHGVERSLRIEREGIRYQPAAYEMSALSQIFKGSLVNINVSSLQFDHAVVNRFHDVVMAGGLCLTDRRDGLPQLTRHHEDVSFSSMDELADKVRHFCNPANRLQRAALIKAIQREVVEHSGYPLLAREIHHAIKTMAV